MQGPNLEPFPEGEVPTHDDAADGWIVHETKHVVGPKGFRPAEMSIAALFRDYRIHKGFNDAAVILHKRRS